MAVDLEALTLRLLDAARAAGAEAADAVAVAGDSLSIEVRSGALEHAERAEGVDLGLRVLLGRRQACVSSSDVRDATMALSRDPERRAALEGTRAVGHALAGHPVEALQVVAGVRRVTEITNMTILRAETALAEALAHRELGDWARAQQQLREIADAPAETMLFASVLARLELVDAHLDTGDVEAAMPAEPRGRVVPELGRSPPACASLLAQQLDVPLIRVLGQVPGPAGAGEQVGRGVERQERREDALRARADRHLAVLVVVLGLVRLWTVCPDRTRRVHVAGADAADLVRPATGQSLQTHHVGNDCR